MPSLILNGGDLTQMVVAINEGRATMLLPCYMCKGEPLRGVMGEDDVVALFTPQRKTYTMSCGHTIT